MRSATTASAIDVSRATHSQCDVPNLGGRKTSEQGDEREAKGRRKGGERETNGRRTVDENETTGRRTESEPETTLTCDY
eukprot:1349894-Alexandrium_andersonii.AAC.1